jgi:probable rRNA maturation factor
VEVNWDEIEDFVAALPPRLAREPYTICLVSDRAMREYNNRYRGVGTTTDVLAFPAAAHGETLDGYLGDIVISAEAARRNAVMHVLRVEDEIKALILHGLLHLLGEDHETDGGRMARAERCWGQRLGLPQTLLTR